MKVVGFILGGNLYVAELTDNKYKDVMRVDTVITPQGIGNIIVPLPIKFINPNDKIIPVELDDKIIKQYEEIKAQMYGITIANSNDIQQFDKFHVIKK